MSNTHARGGGLPGNFWACRIMGRASLHSPIGLYFHSDRTASRGLPLGRTVEGRSHVAGWGWLAHHLPHKSSQSLAVHSQLAGSCARTPTPGRGHRQMVRCVAARLGSFLMASLAHWPACARIPFKHRHLQPPSCLGDGLLDLDLCEPRPVRGLWKPCSTKQTLASVSGRRDLNSAPSLGKLLHSQSLSFITHKMGITVMSPP